jgi:CHAT domain-containing protein/tetratricopeptide (TPR) repeat protein
MKARPARAMMLAAMLAACGADRTPPRSATPEDSARVVAPPLQRNARVAHAESLYFAGQYRQARDTWTATLRAPEIAADSAMQAHVLMWLGLASWRLADYPAARELGERALALKQRLGRTRDLARSFNALGLLARDEGRLADAAALFERAASAATTSGDSADLARAAGNLALVQLDLGDFAAARGGFETARAAGLAMGDGRVAGNALTNLGMMTIRLGDPSGAIPLLREARRQYASAGYGTGQQNMLAQLATAYDLLGEPQRALAALDTATRMARELGLRQEEASNLRLFAELYQSLGDHARALSYFERAERLSGELSLMQEIGIVHRSKARSQWQLGDAGGARASATRALAAHRAQRALFEELTDLLLLAELSDDATASGDRWLAEARSVAARLDAPAARAELALSEARVADRRGDAARTIAALDRAGRDFAQAHLGDAWEPHALRARALARLGRLDSAASEGRRAVALAQRTRTRIGAGPLRSAFVAERSAIYGDLVIVLLRAGRTAEAFEVADVARGRALLEHIASVRTDVRAGRETFGEGELLLRRIDALRAMLTETGRTPRRDRRPADDERSDRLARELERAESEYEALETIAVREHWREGALLGARPARLDDVRAALAPREALVQYTVLSDRLVSFVVTADGVRSFETRIDEVDLSARVRVARELIGRRSASAESGDAILGALYDLTIRPARDSGVLEGVNRLVVVPHRALVYLPFAALVDRTTGERLADRYALLHQTSAAALTAVRSRDRAAGTRRQLAVFVPLPAILPASREEGEAIGRAVGPARIFSGTSATERGLRNALATSRVVHVASHASLNARNPLFSYVALAPAGGRGRADDGRLELNEVFALPIATSLVFLSGCETGLGPAWTNEFTRGEDYATLGQTFLLAGARSVVSTLWRIDDAGAAFVASAFYRHLERLPPAEALAAAQRDARRDARFGSPYYWAAYQVSGGGEKPGLESAWWNPFN